MEKWGMTPSFEHPRLDPAQAKLAGVIFFALIQIGDSQGLPSASERKTGRHVQ
jgi:hypothetical protein